MTTSDIEMYESSDGEEKLKNILDILLNMETINGRHTRANLEPQRDDRVKKSRKLLDSLARLIVKEERKESRKKSRDKSKDGGLESKRDICIAVCRAEVRGEGYLLIANNLEQPNGPKEFLPILSNFVKEESEEKKLEHFWKLTDLVIENSFALMGRTSTEVASGKSGRVKSSGDKESEEKQSIMQKISGYSNQKNTLNQEKRIESMKEILDDYSSKKISDYDWECLMPMNDLNSIICAINDDSSETEVKELIEIIKKENFEYVTGKKNEHAEMKIVNELLRNETKGKYYVGISKLTCSPCYAAIESINEDVSNGLDVVTRGTHGATYGKDWEMPEKIKIYMRHIIGKLESKLICEKSKESTSEALNKNGLESECIARIIQPTSPPHGTSSFHEKW